jgi:hypothetical protein
LGRIRDDCGRGLLGRRQRALSSERFQVRG